MFKTQYAVAVWLSSHTHDHTLQQYIASPLNNHQPSFVKDSGLLSGNSDFIEALCYDSRLDMFDIIDRVSYAKYFRSECVKMLYPQQFANYGALIFVYGRQGKGDVIHPQLFEDRSFNSVDGRLHYAGCIKFDIPGH